ncbi:MAG: N-acetylmuramic acid 6-phosphate etherase [Anaerolineae bacterium]
MLTEQRNPKTQNLDQLSTLEILQTINEEDQKVALIVREVIPQIALAVDAVSTAFANGGRLIYVGAGTSGRLGVLDAVECIPTYSTPPGQVMGLLAGGERAMTASIERAEDKPENGANDLRAANLTATDVVVGIAASGTTPYVVGALMYANEVGSVSVAISCNSPAPILDVASIKIPLPVGPEVVTGSTRMKAGTAQKLVLNMLSTASMVRSGKVYGNLMVDVQVVNEKLERRARRIIREMTGVDDTEADDLLKAAGNNVKTAIAMRRRNVDAARARELLREANGHLRKVIDE